MSDLTVPTLIDLDNLEPISIPVKRRGKNYVLREALESVAVRFKNAKARAVKFSDGKSTGIDGLAECEPLLVAGCLFEELPPKQQGGPPTYRSVPEHAIRDWTAREIKPLYEAALKISGLEDDESVESLEKQRDEITRKLAEMAKKEAARKNSQSDTPPTSDSGENSDALLPN